MKGRCVSIQSARFLVSSENSQAGLAAGLQGPFTVLKMFEQEGIDSTVPKVGWFITKGLWSGWF
jgi:hypothetical protein